MGVYDDRLTTLNLLNLEIIGSFIAIFGLSVFILTSYSSKNLIMNSYLSDGQSPPTLPLEHTALVGRILLVTAGFLAAGTTTIRLNQLTQRALLNGRLNDTITPNVWLTLGTWISFAGGMIALAGDYERAMQPPIQRFPIQ